MSFKVGDQVICIDDRKNHPRIDLDFQQWVEEGERYTVRATSMDLSGNYAVLLEEIKNPKIEIKEGPMKGWFEPRFSAKRFVKIEIDKLEIEEVVEEEIFA